MRFRYSFQKIVDLKSNEKTQAEWVLSGAVGRLRDEETNLATLYEEATEVSRQLIDRAEVRTTASELMAYQQYLNHLQDRIKDKAQDVRHAEVAVLEKRQALSSKMVEEKVWSQAREKAYRQFQAVQLKKEQDQLDEMASSRYKKSL